MKSVKGICVIAGLLLLGACGGRSGFGSVEWPELKAFDHQVEQAEARVDAGADAEERSVLAQALKADGEALLASRIPSNVTSRAIVEARLQDIRDLLVELESNESSADVFKAFHPIVEGLMEAAGMPHVHDHDHDHGQDHDHDHDHNHDGDHGHAH